VNGWMDEGDACCSAALQQSRAAGASCRAATKKILHFYQIFKYIHRVLNIDENKN